MLSYDNKLLEIESVEGIEEIWSTIKEAILGGFQKFIPKRMSKDSNSGSPYFLIKIFSVYSVLL